MVNDITGTADMGAARANVAGAGVAGATAAGADVACVAGASGRGVPAEGTRASAGTYTVASSGPDGAIRVEAPTGESMRELGARVAARVHGGDVLLLSGPLGAGKTTFAQGFGRGLGIGEPIVSPTFTIARELSGRFADGTPAHLVHVDAYRLGGSAYAPGQDTVGRLLDELESLGLDEELEDPGEHTVILMEWGEQMVEALAPERLEIHIERPLDAGGQAGAVPSEDAELSGDGMRVVTLVPVGPRWSGFALES